ncbi:hypothetical protein [Haladaptatus caseinilyticus]|nr:hypothetical protein [Haladaptatus caseinilyticus]
MASDPEWVFRRYCLAEILFAVGKGLVALDSHTGSIEFVHEGSYQSPR